MRKVFHFDSPPGEYTSEACVVSCFDARFDLAIRKFLKRRGIAAPDHIKIAGAAKSLASPPDEAARAFVLDQMRISMRRHSPTARSSFSLPYSTSFATSQQDMTASKPQSRYDNRVVSSRILLSLFALVSCARAAARPALTTVMYLVNRPSSIDSFRKNWRQVSIVAPQCFTMDAQGFISGEVPRPVAEAAREHRVALMPLVVNRGFNQPLMHTVLDTPASRARAIRYLLYYALRDGYIGIQFDYENIKYLYRDRFSQFFHEAAVEFHKHRLLLSAAVVGKYADDRNAESPGGYDDWSGVYDYSRLARDADFLSIMAYPQHTGFSGPGPLAGLPWVRKIVDFTRSHMPARKISLGVPLYGYHWIALAAGTDSAAKKWKGRSSGYSATSAMLAKNPPEWRDEECAHRIVFDDSDGRHELWYEDARSLGQKFELTASQRLAGISGWSLGQEDPAMWELLARGYQVRHPRVPVLTGSFEQRSKAAARALGKR